MENKGNKGMNPLAIAITHVLRTRLNEDFLLSGYVRQPNGLTERTLRAG
jgi:hypothetical protein